MRPAWKPFRRKGRNGDRGHGDRVWDKLRRTTAKGDSRIEGSKAAEGQLFQIGVMPRANEIIEQG